MSDWEMHLSRQSESSIAALGVLWGKSDADGRANLLLQHLLDTLAVGELLWDGYLAPVLRDELDGCTAGGGRRFFSWLCGIHDIGKATPAFQQQSRELVVAVRAAGLEVRSLGPQPNRMWRHELASAHILREATARAEWSAEARDWVWPLLAGHHGAFPEKALVLRPPRRALHGQTPAWDGVQQALVALLTVASGYEDLRAAAPRRRPSRACQLAVSGFIIMADWIASDASNFCGIDALADVSPAGARERAARAWEALGLRGGWGRLSAFPDDPVRARFGVAPRPVQSAVVEVAASLPAPGILVVEAPTGEGKTEAALAATEVLAARFGSDGVFVGMPTQATSDPMLGRVGTWAQAVSPGVQIALLHGKRRFNPQWRALLERRRTTPLRTESDSRLDEHGLEDFYGVQPGGIDEGGAAASEAVGAVVEWLLGPKRGLLSPNVVGTVDQLLFAATRTKHVALRFAGLAGKVVILDEVHAADVYMQQFLHEALWWLGDGRVPVVLLSATLAPQQRASLVREYLRGALRDPKLEVPGLGEPGGYPAVTSAWVEEGRPCGAVRVAEQRQPSRTFHVEVLNEEPDEEETALVAFLQAATAEGGCVLVLRNTVGRAQETYTRLRTSLEAEVVLIHGRLTAGDRAQRTDYVLKKLGPPATRRPRPHRLIVVATQVAEQSFDVDVDLLVTDLAPVDLLIQRAGRLHRHDREEDARPPALMTPRIVVTGMGSRSGAPPEIDRATLAVYGEADRAPSRAQSPETRTPYRAAAPLLRTAALVEEATRSGGWELPGDVPELVARAYGRELVTPEPWREAERVEFAAFEALQVRRAARAKPFRLAQVGHRSAETLQGIHGQRTSASSDEESLVAFVRDGPQGVEVLLVEKDGPRFRTLDGHDLGIHGEGVHQGPVCESLIAGAVRLPPWPSLSEQVLVPVPALSELREHPWTRRAHILVLEGGKAEVAGHVIRYDRELGLCVARPTRGTPAVAGTT